MKKYLIACVFMLLLFINQVSQLDASSDDDEDEEEEDDSSNNHKKAIITTTIKNAIGTKVAVVTTKQTISVTQIQNKGAITTKPTVGLKPTFATLRVGQITNKFVFPIGVKTVTSTTKMQSNNKEEKINGKLTKKDEESEDDEEEDEEKPSQEAKKNSDSKNTKGTKPKGKNGQEEDDENTTKSSITKLNRHDDEDEDSPSIKSSNKNNLGSMGEKPNDDDKSKLCQTVIFSNQMLCCKNSPEISLDTKHIMQCSDKAPSSETTDFFKEFNLNQFQKSHPVFNVSFKDIYQSLLTPMKFVECIFKKHKLITYDKEINFDVASQIFSALVPNKWKSILTEAITNCSTIITDIFPTNEIDNILTYPLLLMQCSRRLLLKKCYEMTKESEDESDDTRKCEKNHELFNKCNTFKPKEMEEKKSHIFPLGPCPDLPCNKNPNYFNENGEFIAPFPPDIGKLHTACGTILMLGNKIKNRKSFDDAQKSCCEYGMRSVSPVSFGSIQKQKCLMELYKKHHAAEALTQYRTSGLFESTGTVMWCTTGERTFRNSSWEDGLKLSKFIPDSKCVTLMLMTNSAKFTFTPCNANSPFMCEAPVTTTTTTEKTPIEVKKTKFGKELCDGPKCAFSVKCNTTKESSPYFSTNGTFLLPASKAIYKEGCGASYVFDFRKKLFYAHMEECCKFGMRVLNIETIEKLQCLENIYRDTFPTQKYEFMTRGTDYQCGGKWGWCEAKIPINENLWIKGIPKEKDGCTVVSFSHDDKTRSGLKWVGCLVNTITMCETLPQEQTNSKIQKTISEKSSSALGTAQDQTYAESKKSVAEKKGFFSAITNNKNKASSSKPCVTMCGPSICSTTMLTSKYVAANGSLRVPPSKAIKLTACGATYVFNLKKTDAQQSNKECCDYGMRVASISDKVEVMCLANKFKDLFPTKQTFFLRGSSFMCPGNWIWCDSKKSINSSVWVSEQVPTDQSGCNVIELNPDLSKKSGVKFSNCMENFFALCKDRVV